MKPIFQIFFLVVNNFLTEKVKKNSIWNWNTKYSVITNFSSCDN